MLVGSNNLYKLISMQSSNLKNLFAYGNEGHNLFWQQIPLANYISHRPNLKLIFTLDHTVAGYW